MLSDPSVSDLMSKVGNRYEVSLAVSKRARQIAAKRLREESMDISDTVDIAAKEIESGRITVEKIDVDEDDK